MMRAMPKTTPIKPRSERAKIRAKLMAKARPIAEQGLCLGWNDVLRDLGKKDIDTERTFRIWIAREDKDELDRLCRSARTQFFSRRR